MIKEQEKIRWSKLLPIVQAFVEGKTIQLYANSKWIDMNEGVFDFAHSHERYRVKPEPQTFWLCGETAFTDKATAESYAKRTGYLVTEVREVLS